MPKYCVISYFVRQIWLNLHQLIIDKNVWLDQQDLHSSLDAAVNASYVADMLFKANCKQTQTL